MSYRLVPYDVSPVRTDQWNPRTVPERIYRIEGPGVDRAATDIEVDICRAAQREARDQALAAVAPFAEFVDVTKLGGTPEQALRKAFEP
jgi:hypothetical protein